ncbi:hypothetical protein K474DRAFT_1672532 [Panus rudis PR-1116 ss-1]|nr:hypothetical protein K474DRAFT_1672532 [Panus rudis PR-1116 ss-1]
MMNKHLCLLLVCHVLLAFGAPTDSDVTEFDEWPAEETGHIDRTWEIVLGVVVSLVVCAVLGSVLYVKLRRRRREASRVTGYLRSSNADILSPQHETMITREAKSGLVTAPFLTIQTLAVPDFLPRLRAEIPTWTMQFQVSCWMDESMLEEAVALLRIVGVTCDAVSHAQRYVVVLLT